MIQARKQAEADIIHLKRKVLISAPLTKNPRANQGIINKMNAQEREKEAHMATNLVISLPHAMKCAPNIKTLRKIEERPMIAQLNLKDLSAPLKRSQRSPSKLAHAA